MITILYVLAIAPPSLAAVTLVGHVANNLMNGGFHGFMDDIVAGFTVVILLMVALLFLAMAHWGFIHLFHHS